MAEYDVEQIDKEILPFLSISARPDLKSVAMQYFLGLTGSDEGKRFIISNDKYLKAILDLMQDKQESVARNAYIAMVNLTSDQETCGKILSYDTDPDFVTYMLESILDPGSIFADSTCQILSNMSRFEFCSSKIIMTMMTKKEKIGFERIVTIFCKENYNKNAKLHYLGTLLSNLTQIKDARLALLDKEHFVIQRLLPYTEYADSIIRRGGIVGTLKNCCFETEFHEWLLSDDVDLLPRLLLPLAGPEEFDDDDMEKLPDDLQYLPPEKTREPDPDIRVMLLEAVYQMCAMKSCRKFIKDKNTYAIMRELHKWEKHPSVLNTLEMVIQILIGDEPDAGMENLSTVVIPEDVQKKLDKGDEHMEKQLKEDLDKYEHENVT